MFRVKGFRGLALQPQRRIFLFPAKDICKAQGILPSPLYGVSKKCCSRERFLPTALSGIAFIIIIAVDQISHSTTTPYSLCIRADPDLGSSTYWTAKRLFMWGKIVSLCKGRQQWALYSDAVFLKCRYLGQFNHQLASTDFARERIMSKDATKALLGSSLCTLTSQR